MNEMNIVEAREKLNQVQIHLDNSKQLLKESKVLEQQARVETAEAKKLLAELRELQNVGV